MKLKLFTIILSFFIFSGCYFTVKQGNKKVKSINTESKSFQKLALTDADKIKDHFGNPEFIFERDEYQVYEYNYRKAQTGKLNMIPIVNIIISFFDRPFRGYKTYKINTLYFYLDSSGKVVKSENIKRSGFYPKKISKQYRELMRAHDIKQKELKRQEKAAAKQKK